MSNFNDSVNGPDLKDDRQDPRLGDHDVVQVQAQERDGTYEGDADFDRDNIFPDEDDTRRNFSDEDEQDVADDEVIEEEDEQQDKKGKKKKKSSDGKSKGPLIIIALLALGLIGGIGWFVANTLGLLEKPEPVAETSRPAVVIGMDERTMQEDKRTMFDVPMDDASAPAGFPVGGGGDESVVVPPVGGAESGSVTVPAASDGAVAAAAATATATATAVTATQPKAAEKAAADADASSVVPAIAGGAATSTNPKVAAAGRAAEAAEAAAVKKSSSVKRSQASKPRSQAKKKPAAAKAPAAVAAGSSLPGATLMSIYPKSGPHQQAWIQLEDGRIRVMRVGETVAGKRITRIDGSSNVVHTTGGAIR